MEKLEKMSEGGEVETTVEATSTTQAGNSSRFVAIEFLSQITKARKLIRNVRMYVYIIIII